VDLVPVSMAPAMLRSLRWSGCSTQQWLLRLVRRQCHEGAATAPLRFQVRAPRRMLSNVSSPSLSDAVSISGQPRGAAPTGSCSSSHSGSTSFSASLVGRGSRGICISGCCHWKVVELGPRVLDLCGAAAADLSMPVSWTTSCTARMTAWAMTGAFRRARSGDRERRACLGGEGPSGRRRWRDGRCWSGP
jgi:hypothetical protein